MFDGRFALARHQRQSLLAVLAATVIAGALALAAIGPFRSVAEPDTPIPVRVVDTTAAVAATDTGRTSAPEADIEARSLQTEEPAAPATAPTADGRANARARATNPPPTAPPPTAPPPTAPPPTESAPTDPPETPSSETLPPETQPTVTLPPETQPTVTLPPETPPSQTQPSVTQPTPTPTDTEPTVTQPPEPEPTITIPQPDDDGDS